MIPDTPIKVCSDFSDHTAQYLARMSMQAYLSPASASFAYEKMGALKTIPISIKQHQAYGVIFKDFIVFAFRGTENNFGDILTGIDFKLSDISNYNFAKCHTGFLKAAQQLAPFVHEVISGHTHSFKAVYLTGHSMGGARALLSAHLLEKTIDQKKIVYSYGAPRIGNKALGRILQKSCLHYRVVNTADIVPNLPFRYMGFTHSGTHCYLNLKGNISMNPSWQYLVMDQFLDILMGISKGFSRGIPARAYFRHRITDYIFRLRKVNFDA
ncbi:MAG: lipase family protein [Sneathiella sp.]|nr:lipase family protein [Sneathiella sp.]